MPLVLVAAAALALGVWLGQTLGGGVAPALLLGAGGLLLLARGPVRAPGFVLALTAAGLLLGIPGPDPPLPALAVGTVVDPPARVGRETRLVAASDAGARFRVLFEGARLRLGTGARIAARVPVRGTRTFANPDVPRPHGARAVRGTAVLDDPAALVVAGGVRGPLVVRVVDEARGRARAAFEGGLREPARGVMRALVLGEPAALDPGAALAFRGTGTVHVLAVSGLHVALVALSVQALLLALLRRVAWLARRTEAARVAAWGAMPLVILYVLFAGAGPSAVRAAVMALAALFARATGRARMAAAALGMAAIVQLAIWPEQIEAPGLQLSYGAVLGLLLLAAPLQARLSAHLVGDPERAGPVRRRLGRALSGLLAANVAATAATAPLVAHHFGQVTPIALVANLIAVPVASAVLLPVGLGLALVAQLSPSWAASLGVLAQLPCDVLSLLLARIARWPGASLAVVPPGALATFLMLALVLSLRFGRLRSRLARVLLVALIATAPALHAGCRARLDDRVRLTVLDVGQGDASVLELPGGEAVLFDAGGLPGSRTDPGARVVVPYLRARGVRRIAALIVSHPHPDHYGGAAAGARALPVGAVWENGQARIGQAGGAFGALLAGLRARGIEVQGPARLCGRAPRFGPVRLRVLAPCPEPGDEEAPNDASLVVEVEHGRVRFLMPGDIEQRGEAELLARHPRLAADVLKVPHHGSATSSGGALLAAVRPPWAVVSCGAFNRFGHPADAVVARYRAAKTRLFRTDVDGGVRFVSDGRSVRLEATGRAVPR